MERLSYKYGLDKTKCARLRKNKLQFCSLQSVTKYLNWIINISNMQYKEFVIVIVYILTDMFTIMRSYYWFIYAATENNYTLLSIYFYLKAGFGHRESSSWQIKLIS